MKLAAACILMLLSSPVFAEEPDTLDRMVALAHSGCDFLHSHSYDDPGPMWPDRKLAAHLGRVLRSAPFGATTDYYLAVDGFGGWKIIYRSRTVTIYLPAELTVRMAALQRILGVPKSPNLDYARSATPATTSPARQSEWAFPKTPDRPSCRIRATSDGPEDGDVASQRVLTFSFSD